MKTLKFFSEKLEPRKKTGKITCLNERKPH